MDTIAAIATAPGKGGVGIVRISGANARAIAQAVLGECPPIRQAVYQNFLQADGSVIDAGISLYFQAPQSFTGEDVLELQGHGGPVILDMLLERCVQLGARLAQPGEFSQRAFLNDKLDLAQAEAIADLIDAGSRAAATAAMRSLQGDFSHAVHGLLQQLIELRVFVEAAIDFPEEEIDFLADEGLQIRMHALQDASETLLQKAEQGRLLHDGLTIVLTGQPNAGKSSLLNALVQADAAIVTDIPGTTRDVLKEYIQLDGLPLHVIDTAGLRETQDVIEAEGVRRAHAAIEQADRVLLLVDDQTGVSPADEAVLASLPEHLPVTVVHNKIDLSGRTPWQNSKSVGLSAKQGLGMDGLKQHLLESTAYTGGDFSARRRHIEALQQAHQAINQAAQELFVSKAGELVAENLSYAQQFLAEVTGEFTSDDLLGKIFSSFCIGK